MLQVDVLSSYVICGAGSLVGAGMMRLTNSTDPRTRRALNITTLGFLVLGLSLGSVFFVGSQLSLFNLSLIAAGTLGSTVLFASGLAMLTGEQPLSHAHTAALLGLAVLVAILGPLGNPTLLSQVLAVGLSFTSTLMAYKTRRFLLSPRDITERAVGWAMAALAVSAGIRALFTFGSSGEPPQHLLHVPAALMSPIAVLYGMFPILVATLLLSVINARLRTALSTQASTDELTGLLTRRALRELAPGALHRQRSNRQLMAVLMLDLDHFKSINDQFGHASGDTVLQQIGGLLRDQVRPDTLLARYGGEEFVVLAPVPQVHLARQVAERLRLAVVTGHWMAADSRPMVVTLSVGVAVVGDNETLDQALQRADKALYRAKHEGRNQVQVAIAAA